MTPTTCQYCGAARIWDGIIARLAHYACGTKARFDWEKMRWRVRMTLQCARKGREG